MHRLVHFPFYPRDFISDPRVTLMSNAEVGAYLRLLCHAWTEGGIPPDGRMRARVMQEPLDVADEMWHAIGPCWQPGPDGRLVNRRMEQERETATAKYSEQCDRAAKAREAKEKNRSNVKANVSPDVKAVTQNSELITTETQNPSSVPNGTAQDDETWNERLAPYARAVGGDAQVGNWLKYWKPLVVNGTEAAEEIMWGLRWLIDKGQLEYMGISKGGTCKPSILRSPRADILKTNALEAYNRHAPNPGQDVVRKLTAI